MSQIHSYNKKIINKTRVCTHICKDIFFSNYKFTEHDILKNINTDLYLISLEHNKMHTIYLHKGVL